MYTSVPGHTVTFIQGIYIDIICFTSAHQLTGLCGICVALMEHIFAGIYIAITLEIKILFSCVTELHMC